MKPRLFVASSVESLKLAYAVQENLEHDSEVTVWAQGVFQLSHTALASLFAALDELDFGLFVLSADDVATIRSETVSTVRDNVIFELGLFAGRLGIERCFLIVPKGPEEVHLPTDLAGITPATFAADRQDGNMSAALGPACNRVRMAMQKYGRVSRDATIVADVTQKVTEYENLCEDQNDCINLIISWLGGRSSSENMSAIRYDEVDRTLKLVSGSAKKYLQAAGVHYNYIVKHAGKDTILFTGSPQGVSYF